MRLFYGWGMLRSMAIAYKNLFRRKITVQYPHERLELPERARWAVEPCFNEDGTSRCTACRMCERACPDHVISIQVETAEDKSRTIAHWSYQLGACMMCGLCVEACPFDAIRMGRVYELACTDPSGLETDLLTDVAVARPKKNPSKSTDRPSVEEKKKGVDADD